MEFKKFDKSRNFNIFIKLPTKERYNVDVSTEMTVFELKDKAEVITGIPRHLQRLRYIDECDMQDGAALWFHHILPDSVIKLCLWPEWRPLVRAACRGDTQAVLASGVSGRRFSLAQPRITYSMDPSPSDKGSTALFIASHRGHINLVAALLKANVKAFEPQPSDRTPVLMAAKNSKVETVDLLLGRSRCVARSYQYDTVRERTLQSLVGLLEKKGACKKLWFAMNQARRDTVRKAVHPDSSLLKQHQMHDSHTPVWMQEPESNKILNNYLASLKKLPRKATGFIVNADLRMTSNGRGIGVFTAEFLPANTRIDDGNIGQCFDREETSLFIESAENDEQRRWWLEHMYGNEGEMRINIDDLDTMMINHSDDPTTVMLPEGDFTTRDVNKGEELTENYEVFEVPPFYDELCKKYGAEHFKPDWK